MTKGDMVRRTTANWYQDADPGVLVGTIDAAYMSADGSEQYYDVTWDGYGVVFHGYRDEDLSLVDP